jgi:glycosyltransferase involved in cell wall biosynthesis
VTYDIVIPAFNHAAFLPMAIESALNQTNPPQRVIVVDDGSEDGTAELAGKTSGIVYIRQENRGLAAARNTGLEMSEADATIFLDADDLLTPTFAQASITALLAQPHALYAYPSVQLFGSDARFFPAPPFDMNRLARSNYITATSLVRRIPGLRFNESFSTWADWEFFVHAAALGHCGVPAKDAVLLYRKHASQASMFDLSNRDPTAEARALIAIQRFHPGVYSIRERIGARRRLAHMHVRRARTRASQWMSSRRT